MPSKSSESKSKVQDTTFQIRAEYAQGALEIINFLFTQSFPVLGHTNAIQQLPLPILSIINFLRHLCTMMLHIYIKICTSHHPFATNIWHYYLSPGLIHLQPLKGFELYCYLSLESYLGENQLQTKLNTKTKSENSIFWSSNFTTENRILFLSFSIHFKRRNLFVFNPRCTSFDFNFH